MKHIAYGLAFALAGKLVTTGSIVAAKSMFAGAVQK